MGTIFLVSVLALVAACGDAADPTRPEAEAAPTLVEEAQAAAPLRYVEGADPSVEFEEGDVTAYALDEDDGPLCMRGAPAGLTC